MEQFYIHLKADSPTLFSVNGNVVGACENPNNKISILTDQRELFLCCYPLNNKADKSRSLSYAAKLTLGSNITCSSDSVTITCYPANHIEVLCHNFSVAYFSTPQKLTSLSLANGNIVTLFEDTKQTFVIENDDLLFSFTLPTILTEYEITETTLQATNCVMLRGKVSADEKAYLLVVGYVNNGYEHLIDLLADKIEESPNGEVASLEMVIDIAKHGYVEKYSFDGNRFTLKDNYTVYMDSAPQLVTHPHLVPYAFMEALNVDNLKLARAYLDQTLSQSLSDAHLRTFFDDYAEVCWNAYDNRAQSLAVICGEKVRKAKIFDFTLAGNKITNITSG